MEFDAGFRQVVAGNECRFVLPHQHFERVHDQRRIQAVELSLVRVRARLNLVDCESPVPSCKLSVSELHVVGSRNPKLTSSPSKWRKAARDREKQAHSVRVRTSCDVVYQVMLICLHVQQASNSVSMIRTHPAVNNVCPLLKLPLRERARVSVSRRTNQQHPRHSAGCLLLVLPFSESWLERFRFSESSMGPPAHRRRRFRPVPARSRRQITSLREQQLVTIAGSDSNALSILLLLNTSDFASSCGLIKLRNR